MKRKFLENRFKTIKIITVVSFFCITRIYSQNWCPPEAIWHYTDESAGMSGYSKLTYTNDTIINGFNCKKLTCYRQGMNGPFPYSYYTTPFYTYEQNGVAYLYNNRYGNNKFDTLFDINAQIGNKWHLPLIDTACADSLYYMEVLNVGTKSINSITLKWLYVKAGPLGGSFPYGFDTITERLGYRYDDICYSFICNNIPDECIHGALRCYTDSSFGLYSTGISTSCDYFTTSVEEPELNHLTFSIYPNPATEQLNIVFNDTTEAMASVQIHDIVGRLIEQVTIKTGELYSYNTLSLPRSIYTVSFYLNNKLIENKKLVLIK